MESMGPRYRLAVYRPNSVRTGFLTSPVSWSASFPANDLGALQLSCAAGSQDAELLAEPCEVAVEVHDGEKWIEPPNARYMRVETSVDSATGDVATVSYTMVSYASLMDGVVVIPPKYSKAEFFDQDGKRKFLSATVGQIVETVLREAKGLVPGLAPVLRFTGTGEKDSSGAAWKKRMTLYYEPGLSLLSILQNLAAQGFCDWWVQGRELKVVNPDSSGRKTQVQVVPVGASESPMRATIGGLLHTVLLVGDGETWRVDNQAAPAPWGKTMKVLTQGGVRDERTARQMIEKELEAGSRERFEYTWQAPDASLWWRPMVDVCPFDWVTFKGAKRVEDMRVFQVTLAFDDSGVKVSLTLNDRFEDAQVRQAKRMKGIVNGASGDAGTGTVPARLDTLKAEPAAPVGLVAESEGYWDGSLPRSFVRVGFAPVVLDVHGLAITVDRYAVEVAGKTVFSPEPKNVVVDGLTPNKRVGIRVWAISRDGVWSDALTGEITTVEPEAKLPPPTALTGTGESGVVELSWDGYLQPPGGEKVEPPPHFSHLNVYEQDPVSDGWKFVGTMYGNRMVLDRSSWLKSGDERLPIRYKAESVTVNGLQSEDFSPEGTVFIESKLWREISRQQQQIYDQVSKGPIEISRLAASPGNKWNNGVIKAMVADQGFVKLLHSEKILIGTPENPVQSVGIADGAVTAQKVQASEALVRKLMTDSLMSGKITTRMFSTNAAFEGPGVHISNGGIRVTSDGGVEIGINPSIGLYAINRHNVRTLHIRPDGSAEFSGNITSKSTIKGANVEGVTVSGSMIRGGTIEGAIIRSEKYENYLQMTGGELKGVSGNDLNIKMTHNSLDFYDKSKYIGGIMMSPYEEAPHLNSILIGVGGDKNIGDSRAVVFGHWDARKKSYTRDVVYDPYGRHYGQPGVKFDVPIVCNDNHASDPNQSLVFSTIGTSAGRFAGVFSRQIKSGVVFGGDNLYFLHRGYYYEFQKILDKIGW